MAASKSTALKTVAKRIPTQPRARTGRDTNRQRAMCAKVTTRRFTPAEPLTPADVRARVTSGDYRAAVIVKGTKVI